MGVGILGCGEWGANHARVWDELGELAAVCDPDPARLDAVRDRYPGVPTADDPARLIAHRTWRRWWWRRGRPKRPWRS